MIRGITHDIAKCVRRRIWSLAFFALVAIASVPYYAKADDLTVDQIDANALINRLSDVLTQGTNNTAKKISDLGFADQIRELGTASQIQSFSSDMLIETLYRRADMGHAGDGIRLLARFYHGIVATSALAAADPAFAELRAISKEKVDQPFIFAPLEKIASLPGLPPLPPKIEKAIGKMAQYYSGSQLGRARALLMKNFRLKSGEFERTLAESKSVEDALRRLVAGYRPPPPLEAALQGTLLDAGTMSAMLSIDPEFVKIIEELSEDLPPELRKFDELQDKLKSRQRQLQQAKQAHQPGKVPTLVASSMDQGASDLAQRVEADSGEAFSRYMANTFETLEPDGASAPNPSQPKPDLDAILDQLGGASGGGGGIEPTSRSYRVAIRSAKAARGVAAGGVVESNIAEVPKSAIWVPNAKNPSFGRLFVILATQDKPMVAVSRVMFSDSAFAALAVLTGSFDNEAEFHEGNILVLMSMDPDAAERTLFEELKKLPKDQQQLILKGMERPFEAAVELIRAKKQTQDGVAGFFDKAETWRAIVVHPALAGRELAWSAARVDFSFEKLDQLSVEASQINGGVTLPEDLKRTFRGDVATWQFFERDAEIQLGEPDGNVRPIKVISDDDFGRSDRSHFSVSMFATFDMPDEQCEPFSAFEFACYMPEESMEMQPLLDWLAVNHHDYMRLNDFSEVFSLLRWLQSNDVTLTALDLGGMLDPAANGRSIATPNLTVLGQGAAVYQ